MTDFQPEPARHADGSMVSPETMAQRLARKGDHFRQGDVLAVRSNIPADVKPVPRDKGSVVLAYGEVTGHSHQLRGPNITMYRDTAGHEYIRATATEMLGHEEHSAIPVAGGEYELAQQVRYSPAELVRETD